MDQPTHSDVPVVSGTQILKGGTSATSKRNFASRLFGYDIFLSFSLRPPPCGTRSDTSDLARRLRERNFTVFFSEEEAPLGDPVRQQQSQTNN